MDVTYEQSKKTEGSRKWRSNEYCPFFYVVVSCLKENNSTQLVTVRDLLLDSQQNFSVPLIKAIDGIETFHLGGESIGILIFQMLAQRLQESKMKKFMLGDESWWYAYVRIYYY